MDGRVRCCQAAWFLVMGVDVGVGVGEVFSAKI